MILRPPAFSLAALLAAALIAADAKAQNRGQRQSRPVNAARSFGVNRGGLGISGRMARPSSRPSAYRSTYRAGQPLGGRNLGAVNRGSSTNTGGIRPPSNNWASPRQTIGNTYGRNSGISRLQGNRNVNANANSNGHRIENAYGRNGNANNRHAGDSSGRNRGYWSGHNNSNNNVNRSGNNQARCNNWNSPRPVGAVRGINVRNGYTYPSRNCNTIIGYGANTRYSSGACRTGFGYPYYGGYYGGGYAYRYPLYPTTGFGVYRGISYDSYSEGDVFDSLSTDIEMTQEEIEEAEAVAREMEAHRQSALQSNALDEFGRKHADSPAQGVTGMTPEVQTTAREIGEALGRGDRAFESGDYDKARDEYVRAVVLAGEDAGVRIALGLAEYALGAYRDASIAVRRGVARSPALANSDFDLRAVYGNPADFEAHRHMLEQHVAANPDDADSQFLLGFVQFFSGRRAEGKLTLDAYLANLAHDDSVREFIETAKVAMPR